MNKGVTVQLFRTSMHWLIPLVERFQHILSLCLDWQNLRAVLPIYVTTFTGLKAETESHAGKVHS